MAIKQLLKRTSGWLYLNSSVGRNQLQGAGVILMLHRVLANDRAADLPHRNELCVGPKAFEHLLVWLRKHFDCVPLMEILQPNSLRTERPRVALTFDDGWRDNAVNAFPLLQNIRCRRAFSSPPISSAAVSVSGGKASAKPCGAAMETRRGCT